MTFPAVIEIKVPSGVLTVALNVPIEDWPMDVIWPETGPAERAMLVIEPPLSDAETPLGEL